MPVGINQPSNQIKLTNVSLVRMKKGVQIRFYTL
jgi:ribosome maturation protein SDO1